MRILIVAQQLVPAIKYGGTERVVSSLAVALSSMGHRVTLMAAEGSSSPTPDIEVVAYNSALKLCQQIDKNRYDIAHLNFYDDSPIEIPFVVTVHGNAPMGCELSRNSIFVSRNHAERYNSTSFVHNGLDWSQYGSVDLSSTRRYFHFLGKAAWRIKNIQGAIDVVLGAPKAKLEVLGGNRVNIKMGFRLTLNPRIHFNGMVGGEIKNLLLTHSKGLIFPVRWHEPFGLALTESLYFGCPVFGTPYGSLPEIITEQYGVLSTSCHELSQALLSADRFDARELHNYAATKFDARTMAFRYLECYERVLSGEYLNSSPVALQAPTDKFLPWEC